MSLNVGGLYVGVKDGVTAEAVVSSIDAHWRAIGAVPLQGEPLDLSPLSVKKTARLGFAVTPEGRDERGERWIGVYDSERYTADPTLARHLAEALGVPVVFFEVSGASGDYASVKVYGVGGPDPPKRSEIVEWLEGFPYPLVYFNQLKEADELEHWQIFGF